MQYKAIVFVLLGLVIAFTGAMEPLPSFMKMKANYPGYKHWGGHYYNNKLVDMIGCERNLLLHDTSALRLSYSFNKVGGVHSLGKNLIHLSRNGIDSVTGRDGLQYIYHPIAYGPFLADKYGYPSITKLHQLDPISTKKNFWGKQGILRVITYRKIKNLPVGHVALWDCDHFHETKDWISGHSLITVEFWESPDSNCSVNQLPASSSNNVTSQPIHSSPSAFNTGQPKTELPTHHISTNNSWSNQSNTDLKTMLQNKAFRKQFIKKYYVSNGHLRHAKHRGLTLNKHNNHAVRPSS